MQSSPARKDNLEELFPHTGEDNQIIYSRVMIS